MTETNINEIKTETKIDYLTEDSEIANQHWLCISFLSPEGIKNCKIRGQKIRGVYNTKEEANERAKFLQQIDPDFNIFVGEVGKWFTFDPDVNSIDDQVYAEEQLNDLMKGYKKNLEKTKVLEQQRKMELLKDQKVRKPKEDNKETIKERLRKRLEEKSKQIEEPNKDIKKDEKSKEEVKPENIIEKEKEEKSIDENLRKVEELYKKMIQKTENK